MCESIHPTSRGRMIPLDQAIGTVLAHDLTEIRPVEFKGPAFRKGHVVREEDLEHLLRLGKRHLYVLDIDPESMHEDEAALVLAEALAGDGVTFNPHPSEGKINLRAARDGLLKVHVEALTDFNLVDGVMCATRHTHTVVRRDEVVGGTRAIPLVISRTAVEQAAKIGRAAGGILSVLALKSLRTGLIVTGNEVYSGLIQDRFIPAIRPKLDAFHCPVIGERFCPDDADIIAKTVRGFIASGAELIVTTGGLSVDPDDVTRLGVVKAGAVDYLYGSSVLPGAMLLLARVQGVPVIGVPACGMFHETTIFDLVLPRILAGERPTRRDLAALGHGGLCLNCSPCRFPRCAFGKGS